MMIKSLEVVWYFKEALRFYVYNHFISGIPLYKVRHFYLRKILKYKIDRNASIHMGCFFTGNHFEIGRGSVVNRKCYLDCRAGITIGNNVSISPECYLISVGHDPDSKDFSAMSAQVTIEDYVWLGARAMVLPGKKLLKGSVLAAGSVLTRDFPQFSILGGNPARLIRIRGTNLTYNLAWFPFFDTDIMN